MLSFIQKKLKGFTLTEILIALAILGVLGATIFSSLGGSNEKSKVISARDSLNELGKALQTYQRESGTLPMPVQVDGATEQGQDFVGFLSTKSSLAGYVGKYKTDTKGLVLINNNPVFYIRDASKQYYVIGVNVPSQESIAGTFELIPSTYAATQDLIIDTNYPGIGRNSAALLIGTGELSYGNTNPTTSGFVTRYSSPGSVVIILSKTGSTVPTFTLKLDNGSDEALTVQSIDGGTAVAGEYLYKLVSPTQSFKIDSRVDGTFPDSSTFKAYTMPEGDLITPALASGGGGGGGGGPAPASCITASEVTQLNAFLGGTRTAAQLCAITSLNLDMWNTTGSIPAALGKLTGLTNLEFNNFNAGPITIPSLTGLTNLQTFSIGGGYTSLTNGSLDFSGLSHLNVISIMNSSVSTSVNVGNNPALTTVRLSMGGAPTLTLSTSMPSITDIYFGTEGGGTIVNLPNASGLLRLSLSDMFAPIAADYQNNTSIQELSLTFVDALPLNNLTNLRKLALDFESGSNHISALNSALGSLPALADLYIGGPGAMGLVPALAASNASTITKLDIRADNTFTDLPAGILSFTNLGYLNISDNTSMENALDLTSLTLLTQVQAKNTPSLNQSTLIVNPGVQVFLDILF